MSPSSKAERVVLRGFRHYSVDGAPPVPSVTSILALAGAKSLVEAQAAAKELDEDEWMQNRSNQGTNSHDRIEQILGGDSVKPMEPDRNALAGVRWARVNMEEIQGLEVGVWHPAGWAGTLDFIGITRASGELVVGDWKTRGYPKPPGPDLLEKHKLQGTAYALAWEHLHPGRPVKQIRIIYLGNGRVVLDERIDLIGGEGAELAGRWLLALRRAQALLAGETL